MSASELESTIEKHSTDAALWVWESLWSVERHAEINILDTILFESPADGCRIKRWLFTSKKTKQVLRKSDQNTTLAAAKAHFLSTSPAAGGGGDPFFAGPPLGEAHFWQGAPPEPVLAATWDVVVGGHRPVAAVVGGAYVHTYTPERSPHSSSSSRQGPRWPAGAAGRAPRLRLAWEVPRGEGKVAAAAAAVHRVAAPGTLGYASTTADGGPLSNLVRNKDKKLNTLLIQETTKLIKWLESTKSIKISKLVVLYRVQNGVAYLDHAEEVAATPKAAAARGAAAAALARAHGKGAHKSVDLRGFLGGGAAAPMSGVEEGTEAPPPAAPGRAAAAAAAAAAAGGGGVAGEGSEEEKGGEDDDDEDEPVEFYLRQVGMRAGLGEGGGGGGGRRGRAAGGLPAVQGAAAAPAPAAAAGAGAPGGGCEGDFCGYNSGEEKARLSPPAGGEGGEGGGGGGGPRSLLAPPRAGSPLCRGPGALCLAFQSVRRARDEAGGALEEEGWDHVWTPALRHWWKRKGYRQMDAASLDAGSAQRAFLDQYKEIKVCSECYKVYTTLDKKRKMLRRLGKKRYLARTGQDPGHGEEQKAMIKSRSAPDGVLAGGAGAGAAGAAKKKRVSSAQQARRAARRQVEVNSRLSRAKEKKGNSPEKIQRVTRATKIEPISPNKKRAAETKAKKSMVASPGKRPKKQPVYQPPPWEYAKAGAKALAPNPDEPIPEGSAIFWNPRRITTADVLAEEAEARAAKAATKPSPSPGKAAAAAAAGSGVPPGRPGRGGGGGARGKKGASPAGPPAAGPGGEGAEGRRRGRGLAAAGQAALEELRATMFAGEGREGLGEMDYNYDPALLGPKGGKYQKANFEESMRKKPQKQQRQQQPPQPSPQQLRARRRRREEERRQRRGRRLPPPSTKWDALLHPWQRELEQAKRKALLEQMQKEEAEKLEKEHRRQMKLMKQGKVQPAQPRDFEESRLLPSPIPLTVHISEDEGAMHPSHPGEEEEEGVGEEEEEDGGGGRPGRPGALGARLPAAPENLQEEDESDDEEELNSSTTASPGKAFLMNGMDVSEAISSPASPLKAGPAAAAAAAAAAASPLGQGVPAAFPSPVGPGRGGRLARQILATAEHRLRARGLLDPPPPRKKLPPGHLSKEEIHANQLKAELSRALTLIEAHDLTQSQFGSAPATPSLSQNFEKSFFEQLGKIMRVATSATTPGAPQSLSEQAKKAAAAPTFNTGLKIAEEEAKINKKLHLQLCDICAKFPIARKCKDCEKTTCGPCFFKSHRTAEEKAHEVVFVGSGSKAMEEALRLSAEAAASAGGPSPARGGAAAAAAATLVPEVERTLWEVRQGLPGGGGAPFPGPPEGLRRGRGAAKAAAAAATGAAAGGGAAPPVYDHLSPEQLARRYAARQDHRDVAFMDQPNLPQVPNECMSWRRELFAGTMIIIAQRLDQLSEKRPPSNQMVEEGGRKSSRYTIKSKGIGVVRGHSRSSSGLLDPIPDGLHYQAAVYSAKYQDIDKVAEEIHGKARALLTKAAPQRTVLGSGAGGASPAAAAAADAAAPSAAVKAFRRRERAISDALLPPGSPADAEAGVGRADRMLASIRDNLKAMKSQQHSAQGNEGPESAFGKGEDESFLAEDSSLPLPEDDHKVVNAQAQAEEVSSPLKEKIDEKDAQIMAMMAQLERLKSQNQQYQMFVEKVQQEQQIQKQIKDLEEENESWKKFKKEVSSKPQTPEIITKAKEKLHKTAEDMQKDELLKGSYATAAMDSKRSSLRHSPILQGVKEEQETSLFETFPSNCSTSRRAIEDVAPLTHSPIEVERVSDLTAPGAGGRLSTLTFSNRRSSELEEMDDNSLTPLKGRTIQGGPLPMVHHSTSPTKHPSDQQLAKSGVEHKFPRQGRCSSNASSLGSPVKQGQRSHASSVGDSDLEDMDDSLLVTKTACLAPLVLGPQHKATGGAPRRRRARSPGWVRLFDAASGAHYWYNEVTMASEWEWEAAAAAGGAGASGGGGGGFCEEGGGGSGAAPAPGPGPAGVEQDYDPTLLSRPHGHAEDDWPAPEQSIEDFLQEKAKTHHSPARGIKSLSRDSSHTEDGTDGAPSNAVPYFSDEQQTPTPGLESVPRLGHTGPIKPKVASSKGETAADEMAGVADPPPEPDTDASLPPQGQAVAAQKFVVDALGGADGSPNNAVPSHFSDKQQTPAPGLEALPKSSHTGPLKPRVTSSRGKTAADAVAGVADPPPEPYTDVSSSPQGHNVIQKQFLSVSQMSAEVTQEHAIPRSPSPKISGQSKQGPVVNEHICLATNSGGAVRDLDQRLLPKKDKHKVELKTDNDVAEKPSHNVLVQLGSSDVDTVERQAISCIDGATIQKVGPNGGAATHSDIVVGPEIGRKVAGDPMRNIPACSVKLDGPQCTQSPSMQRETQQLSPEYGHESSNSVGQGPSLMTDDNTNKSFLRGERSANDSQDTESKRKETMDASDFFSSLQSLQTGGQEPDLANSSVGSPDNAAVPGPAESNNKKGHDKASSLLSASKKEVSLSKQGDNLPASELAVGSPDTSVSAPVETSNTQDGVVLPTSNAPEGAHLVSSAPEEHEIDVMTKQGCSVAKPANELFCRAVRPSESIEKIEQLFGGESPSKPVDLVEQTVFIGPTEQQESTLSHQEVEDAVQALCSPSSADFVAPKGMTNKVPEGMQLQRVGSEASMPKSEVRECSEVKRQESVAYSAEDYSGPGADSAAECQRKDKQKLQVGASVSEKFQDESCSLKENGSRAENIQESNEENRSILHLVGEAMANMDLSTLHHDSSETTVIKQKKIQDPAFSSKGVIDATSLGHVDESNHQLDSQRDRQPDCEKTYFGRVPDHFDSMHAGEAVQSQKESSISHENKEIDYAQRKESKSASIAAREGAALESLSVLHQYNMDTKSCTDCSEPSSPVIKDADLASDDSNTMLHGSSNANPHSRKQSQKEVFVGHPSPRGDSLGALRRPHSGGASPQSFTTLSTDQLADQLQEMHTVEDTVEGKQRRHSSGKPIMFPFSSGGSSTSSKLLARAKSMDSLEFMADEVHLKEIHNQHIIEQEARHWSVEAEKERQLAELQTRIASRHQQRGAIPLKTNGSSIPNYQEGDIAAVAWLRGQRAVARAEAQNLRTQLDTEKRRQQVHLQERLNLKQRTRRNLLDGTPSQTPSIASSSDFASPPTGNIPVEEEKQSQETSGVMLSTTTHDGCGDHKSQEGGGSSITLGDEGEDV